MNLCASIRSDLCPQPVLAEILDAAADPLEIQIDAEIDLRSHEGICCAHDVSSRGFQIHLAKCALCNSPLAGYPRPTDRWPGCESQAALMKRGRILEMEPRVQEMRGAMCNVDVDVARNMAQGSNEDSTVSRSKPWNSSRLGVSSTTAKGAAALTRAPW